MKGHGLSNYGCCYIIVQFLIQIPFIIYLFLTTDISSLSLWCTAYGQCNNITCLQLPGVLDDLFSYEGPLGAVYSKEAVSLFLWAPTAQVYQFHISHQRILLS